MTDTPDIHQVLPMVEQKPASNGSSWGRLEAFRQCRPCQHAVQRDFEEAAAGQTIRTKNTHACAAVLNWPNGETRILMLGRSGEACRLHYDPQDVHVLVLHASTGQHPLLQAHAMACWTLNKHRWDLHSAQCCKTYGACWQQQIAVSNWHMTGASFPVIDALLNIAHLSSLSRHMHVQMAVLGRVSWCLQFCHDYESLDAFDRQIHIEAPHRSSPTTVPTKFDWHSSLIIQFSGAHSSSDISSLTLLLFSHRRPWRLHTVLFGMHRRDRWLWEFIHTPASHDEF